MTIPSSVTTIGYAAFSGCSGLTSVTIPSSVTTIGFWAFYGCTELANVYCYAETLPETGSGAFEGSYIEYSTLHVLASAIEQYRTKEPWSGFGTIVAIDGEDAVTQVKAVPVMIQAEGGVLRIDGAQAGMPIGVYDLSGRLIANTTAIGNSTRVAMPMGEKVVVVKVGERVVKVRR